MATTFINFLSNNHEMFDTQETTDNADGKNEAA
jgi:hypothetical protein